MRLIPAHAGKTIAVLSDLADGAAHPRSRGENRSAMSVSTTALGSSPLTRGKPLVKGRAIEETRLIPAHAGKTPQVGSDRPFTRAHPRSRGENRARPLVGARSRGSSPLTRGKRAPARRHRVPGGLIPAHAGKTGGDERVHGFGPAHPRSRGENLKGVGHSMGASGSSPLTRGKRLIILFLSFFQRLIPAHAGKTSAVWVVIFGLPAHPRSRGENRGERARWIRRDGSSPLTRGKPAAQRLSDVRERLIPAHAGKTRTMIRRTCAPTAHPRSRGENTSRPALLLRRSIRSWKPLSLPSPLEVTQFGSLAQLTRRRIRFGVLASSFRVVGAHHECESIEVNGLPWVSPRQEGESLLVARPVDHDGTSGLHVLSDDVPQALAYTGAERPHEDPRGNLHEPPRHVTSQPLGHRGQDQDDHQESLSS